MPRKRIKTPDDYDKGVPTAIRQLMEDTHHTQSELADYLVKNDDRIDKLSRQAVAYYCDGKSSPDWETLVLIARFFNCSVDYLVDPFHKPRSIDTDIKMICEYTGLSEEAVANLHDLKNKQFVPSQVATSPEKLKEAEAALSYENDDYPIDGVNYLLGLDSDLLAGLSFSVKAAVNCPRVRSFENKDLAFLAMKTDNAAVFRTINDLGGDYLSPSEVERYRDFQTSVILQKIIDRARDKKREAAPKELAVTNQGEG